MVADHWFQQVDKILEAMEITSDTNKITVAALHLEGEAHLWWDWANASKNVEVMTWGEFRELFMGKYFPLVVRHAKAREFLDLKKGTMTVMK